MKRKYQTVFGEATAKPLELALGSLRLECRLALPEFIAGMRDDMEVSSAELGLKIMLRVMEEEIATRVRAHGSQNDYRHGSQAGSWCSRGARSASSGLGCARKRARRQPWRVTAPSRRTGACSGLR
jgi:hypothetical protein